MITSLDTNHSSVSPQEKEPTHPPRTINSTLTRILITIVRRAALSMCDPAIILQTI